MQCVCVRECLCVLCDMQPRVVVLKPQIPLIVTELYLFQALHTTSRVIAVFFFLAFALFHTRQ